jgi:gamma-glutamyltranspeptidase/glutathione hydrolase
MDAGCDDVTDWRDLLDDHRMLDRSDRRDDSAAWSASSTHGVIATAHYRATAVGAEILEAGGNAVDAAIAAGFALGVVEPGGSSVGGMAMMLIHRAATGETIALDGSCRAPRRATPELLAHANRNRGHRAVAVPTHVAVMEHARKNFGRMTAAQLVAPAVRLAEEGFPLAPLQRALLLENRRPLRKRSGGRFLLDADGRPPAIGSRITQPILARTLRRLGEAGPLDFYTGEIAQLIHDDMQQHNGLLDRDDLADIPWPVEREPLTGSFGGWSVRALPPPGGGATLLQMLHLFDALAPDELDPDSPEAAVLFATIIRRARCDRRRYRLGRAGKHGDAVPDRTSLAYARKTAATLRQRLDRRGETSHLSIIDPEGNAAALTQSIERSFGSMTAAEELGFLYNGYMRAFKLVNQRHPHYLRPGAVARSNAAPTIVLQGGRPRAVIGSTGSERMASGIVEVLARLRTQSAFEAVLAPRLHCTPQGEVLLEADRFSTEALDALRRHGFTISPLDAWSFKVGGLQLATYENGTCCAVADPRRDGAGAGAGI